MIKVNIFGKNAQLHHIGLAVTSISKEVKILGCKKPKVFLDKIQKVKVAFINLNGAPIELIEPIDNNSPITLNLKKKQSLVHICYEVPCFKKAVKNARKFGFYSISTPVDAKAFQDKKIIWLYNQSFGLIELLEK